MYTNHSVFVFVLRTERIDNNAGDGDDDVLPENLDPTTDNDEKDTAIVQSSGNVWYTSNFRPTYYGIPLSAVRYYDP